ncbi:Dioxygenase-N domain-containing protein [Fusarium keratoplasticum]|uniref:Dioxygenase-N domain-containing protein n=1 Tax=Fusarium keratoplasticum TaxID=1328300 RepID=A0ACC0QDD4_9HYPO|nr:Dioxygenase-N domain-containing protein [Fusarium keratoplasticum]KAI8650656.1 Dioxygenase-N domain-containing protein [Fusarium keratoplasticum]
MADLTIDNITPNAVTISTRAGDKRLDYVMERSSRMSTISRESILLPDVLGLSLLVDSIDHPKPDNSTQGSVLRPFHTRDDPEVPHGDPISLNDKD